MHVNKPIEDVSPDAVDRIRDFLARHGGPGNLPTAQETHPSGCSGWSETYAADGYALRFDWTREGGHAEMQFSEVPPNSTR